MRSRCCALSTLERLLFTIQTASKIILLPPRPFRSVNRPACLYLLATKAKDLATLRKRAPSIHYSVGCRRPGSVNFPRFSMGWTPSLREQVSINTQHHFWMCSWSIIFVARNCYLQTIEPMGVPRSHPHGFFCSWHFVLFLSQ